MVIISAVLALAFNYSSPNGIPVCRKPFSKPRPPGRCAHGASNAVPQRGGSCGCRPPELFQQKHIAAAVNIPAALFDVIYP